MKDKLQILRNEVERLKEETGIGLSEHDNGVEQGRMEIINTVLFLIDDMLKEPVSFDLVEASRNYADNEEYGDDAYFAIKAAFEAGANWQKEKDVKLIFNAKDDGYRLGLATMKQQMMANAVDAKVCNKAYPTKFEVETNTFMQKLNHGDNVKLIIINED